MSRKMLVNPTTPWADGRGMMTREAFLQIRELFDQVQELQTLVETAQTEVDALETVVSGLSFSSLYTWSSAQATTSGTSKDFTGIPSGATDVIIAFNGVSPSGTDQVLVRLGTASSFISSGYVSTTAGAATGSVAATASTSAMIIGTGNGAGSLRGFMNLHNVGGTLWVQSHTMSRGDSDSSIFGGGSVDIGAALTRLRLLLSGANSFDAGNFYVGYRT